MHFPCLFVLSSDFVKLLVICHIFWAFNSSGLQGIPEENITFSSQSAYLSFCLSPPGPCPLTCPWGLCSSLLNLSGKRNQFYLVYLLFHIFLLEIWISLTLWYCLNMFFLKYSWHSVTLIIIHLVALQHSDLSLQVSFYWSFYLPSYVSSGSKNIC